MSAHLRLAGWPLAVVGTALAMNVAVADAAGQDTACRAALQALHMQEDRVVAARARSDGKAEASVDTKGLRDAQSALQARRQEAAKACLGGRADAPPAATIARPPVAVAAPALPPMRPLPVAPPPATTAPLPRAEPPAFVTGCDAGGCWRSDGTRLPNTGGGVLSPQGPCTVVGAVVNCGR